MRVFGLLLTALFLSACNLSEVAAKLTPDTVEAMAHRDIDALYKEDMGSFAGLQGELTKEELEQGLRAVFAEKRGGEEVSRTLVGASVNKSSELGKGTTARYDLVYEVATGEGFTIVELDYVQNPSDAECCRLERLNIQGFDSSPQVQVIQTLETVSKFIGLALVLMIAGLAFFLMRRSRRKRAA